MKRASQPFDRGYLIAVATLNTAYGHVELCARLIEEAGISRRRAMSLGLDEADRQALTRVYERIAA